MLRTFTLKSLRLDGSGLKNVAVKIVAATCQTDSSKLVVPVNGQVFVIALNEPDLADIITRAEFVVPDGFSIVFGRRVLGDLNVRRVPGVDLIEAVCEEANPLGLRVFLLGGRPGAAERTIEVFKQKMPRLIFDSYCPPMGFEKSTDEVEKIEERVHAFAPHIMFVAFGAPKQERFMDQQLRRTGVPIIMAVGGSFEMIGGMVTRAPRWLGTIGLEWFFRTLMEPRRLFLRYLTSNTIFCWNLMVELLKQPARKA